MMMANTSENLMNGQNGFFMNNANLTTKPFSGYSFNDFFGRTNEQYPTNQMVNFQQIPNYEMNSNPVNEIYDMSNNQMVFFN